ncbi:MAG: VOC family protein [Terriglobales bacterium]
MKPLTRWLWAGYCLFAIPYFFLDPTDGHKALRFVAGVGLWGCFLMAMWIKRRYVFEVLRAPNAKWYLPWNTAEFSIPSNMRIAVRNIDSASPWYIEKLGLRKVGASPSGEPGSVTFKFKEDGNSITLTTRGGFGTNRTPIFFTKKIGRIKDILAARGAAVGVVEKDRQGIYYFEIRDPEGNVLEVVEER